MSLNLSIKFLLGVTVIFCAPFLFSNGIVANFGDIYQYAAPFRHFAKENLQTGTLPLWNPYIFGGTPFLASPQSALFYPLSFLFYFLPLNTAFNFFTAFHLFLNALGMLLLLRSFKYSNTTCLWGSLVWGFSSFFLSKIAAGHVIHLSGYSWFPFVLLFALSSWKTPLYSSSFYCFVLAVSLQFFSGHLQVWFHTILFLALIFLYKFFQCKQNKVFYLGWGIVSSILFLSLVLIQLLPTLKFMGESMRAGMTSLFNIESVYNFATSYSMRWKDLICLIYPNFFGNPITKSYIDPAHPSIYFETQAIYFGFVPLLLAFSANLYLIKKKKYLLPLLSLIFLTLAMGKNSALYDWFWKTLSFLRVPARFYFLFFATSLLAAAFYWEEKIVNQGAKIKWILISLTLLDLFLVSRGWLAAENHLKKLGRSQAMSWLQAQLPNGKADRIFTTGEISNPNKTIFFHLQNFNGYEAIFQKSYLYYFSLSQGADNISSTGALEVPHPNDRSFSLSGVRYLISLNPLDRPWPLKYNDGQIRIYENQNLNRMLQESEFKYFYHRVNSNKMSVKVKNLSQDSSTLRLTEAYAPGWKIWNESGDYQHPYKTDSYFQAMDLTSKEDQKFYWCYWPKEFTIGLLGTVLTLFFLTFLGMRTLATRYL